MLNEYLLYLYLLGVVCSGYLLYRSYLRKDLVWSLVWGVSLVWNSYRSLELWGFLA